MRLGISLAGPTGNDDPIVGIEVIAFNGVRSCNGDCSYESFDLPRVAEFSQRQEPDELGRFLAFCKTAYRPYDLAVQVCLVIAAHHLEAAIVVSSDGSMEDWQDAIALCQQLLGYGGDFQLT